MAITNVILEGVDNLGKSTLIQGLMDRLGFAHVVHFSKPRVLPAYQKELAVINPSADAAEVDRLALRKYQAESYKTFFELLSIPEIRVLADRSHLGEAIYAHRYRGYRGDYVFQLERIYEGGCVTDDDIKQDPLSNTLLVLLTTDDFTPIQDDGLSLDVNQREAEQADFVVAFQRSSFHHKLQLTVTENGKFRPVTELLNEIISSMEKPR